MEKVTFKTLEIRARELLENRKRQPINIAISIVLVALIIMFSIFLYHSLPKLGLEDEEVKFISSVSGMFLLVALIIKPLPKVRVKVSQTEINSCFPGLITTTRDELKTKRMKAYDYIDYYKDKISEKEEEISIIESNLEEIKDILKSFEKAKQMA